MNSFNSNKEIIKLCKNYYKIINADLYADDKVSHNMINLYTDYIFNSNDLPEKKVSIDNIMYKYITDSRFKKEIINKLSILKVSSHVTNVVDFVMNSLIEYFEDYKDTYTRNIYIPRWI